MFFERAILKMYFCGTNFKNVFFERVILKMYFVKKYFLREQFGECTI